MKKVYAMYFSPTGTTKKVVETVAKKIAELNSFDYEVLDFTLPPIRTHEYNFSSDEIVIFGVPVYAGRVPNVLLSFISTIKAQKALAVAVVLFGNRNYDDALIELKTLLEEDGFNVIGAGAFVGEHSFSKVLAAGRPDNEDIMLADEFGSNLSAKINERNIEDTFYVRGENPIRPYYKPTDSNGNFVDIRKVKPKTKEFCIKCGVCASVCPMGSIDKENPNEYLGICIKCGACIKRCPIEAKYYDDYGYLYHKKELEEELTERAKVNLFL